MNRRDTTAGIASQWVAAVEVQGKRTRWAGGCDPPALAGRERAHDSRGPGLGQDDCLPLSRLVSPPGLPGRSPRRSLKHAGEVTRDPCR
jgi:hypothetical protein